MTEAERPNAEPSDLEGGGTEQTWGQGEGTHEATVPDDQRQDDEAAPSYAGGTASELDDSELPLSREDEGMDR